MSHQPNNIAAGTQVVTPTEIRGASDSLVHPRGAVGVVTRTPCAGEASFRVRFPDGYEASLERAQLEVLKHFKDRLARAEVAGSFELERCVIYRCVVGSRAFGLDHDESDTDVRGVYLAPADLQWSLFGAPEQFEDNTAHACYWEPQKFLLIALKANPNILECLSSPLFEKVTPIVAHWPRGISAARRGSLENQPGHVIDIMATCVDLAGAKYPAEFGGHTILPMEGVSLRPALAGQPLGRTQPIFWEHEGNKAVRDGRWKLVMRHRLPWQLFDMERDRTEQHDLIKVHPEIASRLEAAWVAWSDRSFVDEWPGPDRTDWGQDNGQAGFSRLNIDSNHYVSRFSPSGIAVVGRSSYRSCEPLQPRY